MGLRRLLFSLKTILVLSEGTAQIVATPPSGCAPLSVVFSVPAGATNHSWQLGSGMGTSSLANPNVLYINPGNYLITYSGMLNGNPISYTYQFNVGSPPAGSFSFLMPAIHCAPLTVTFSGTGGSTGSTYNWAFGDLSPPRSGNHPVHTYNFQGSFLPVMTIIDAVSGCTAIAVNNSGAINVSTKPVLQISSSNGFF